MRATQFTSYHSAQASACKTVVRPALEHHLRLPDYKRFPANPLQMFQHPGKGPTPIPALSIGSAQRHDSLLHVPTHIVGRRAQKHMGSRTGKLWKKAPCPEGYVSERA